jgi:uncharacterized protein (TIGR00299 family) protein
MFLGALVDAGVALAALNEKIATLGLPGCRLTAAEVKKLGFRATQISVEYTPEDTHRHLAPILGMIAGSSLSPRQQALASRIFRRLAEAEAKVHGTSVEKIHFHEVGAADSIADIVGAAVGWDLLGAERLFCSPVPTGRGTIRIAHGECSIPAPATAELLCGIPLAESAVRAELTTPTGAAILAILADGFGPIPAMTVERIGYGAGCRDLAEQPNLLRLLLGTSANASPGEQVWMAEVNLDDLSGELIGYCTAQLWEAGALDVYTTPIQMKKNRPGVIISVLCGGDRLEAIQSVLFRESSTLGVRCWPVQRQVLRRQTHAVSTPWGTVQGKIGWLADGTPRFSPEFESCRAVAAERGIPLQSVYEAARGAFDANQVRPEPEGS